MSPSKQRSSTVWFVFKVFAICATMSGAFTISAIAQDAAKGNGGAPAKKDAAFPPGAVEVRFVDGSSMKLLLRDEKVELDTAYGKLLIPISEVQRIEFGLRMPEETKKRIDSAIKDLANSDFRRRQAAATELTELKDKAYPSLVNASNGKDAEVNRRIDEIMEKIRETAPTDALDIPPHDIVHTATSKIAGQIRAEKWLVATLPFGDQPVKLADMRTLRAQGVADPETTAAIGQAGILPDPGTLSGFGQQLGRTLSFRVTGPQVGLGNQMGVYGTDVYTTDSTLSAAAVHAGVLKPGETAVVRVTIVGAHPGFQASTRNGIMSYNYGPYAAFRIEQPKKGVKK